MKPGLLQKLESEYIRHGTKCLISNLEVATGKIIAPSIGDSRTELDFLEHIKATVKEDESAEWIFIVDQLNSDLAPHQTKIKSSFI